MMRGPGDAFATWPGSTATTARNIVLSASVFRLGLACALVMLIAKIGAIIVSTRPATLLGAITLR